MHGGFGWIVANPGKAKFYEYANYGITPVSCGLLTFAGSLSVTKTESLYHLADDLCFLIYDAPG